MATKKARKPSYEQLRKALDEAAMRELNQSDRINYLEKAEKRLQESNTDLGRRNEDLAGQVVALAFENG